MRTRNVRASSWDSYVVWILGTSTFRALHNRINTVVVWFVRSGLALFFFFHSFPTRVLLRSDGHYQHGILSWTLFYSFKSPFFWPAVVSGWILLLFFLHPFLKFAARAVHHQPLTRFVFFFFFQLQLFFSSIFTAIIFNILHSKTLFNGKWTRTTNWNNELNMISIKVEKQE